MSIVEIGVQGQVNMNAVAPLHQGRPYSLSPVVEVKCPQPHVPLSVVRPVAVIVVPCAHASLE